MLKIHQEAETKWHDMFLQQQTENAKLSGLLASMGESQVKTETAANAVRTRLENDLKAAMGQRFRIHIINLST